VQQGTPSESFPRSGVYYTETPPVLVRPKATVEIETMTKGTPKVTVRVDDDDPHKAAMLALETYVRTIKVLEHPFDEIDTSKDPYLDPDMDPRITG
jgi:hypothetical protein